MWGGVSHPLFRHLRTRRRGLERGGHSQKQPTLDTCPVPSPDRAIVGSARRFSTSAEPECRYPDPPPTAVHMTTETKGGKCFFPRLVGGPSSLWRVSGEDKNKCALRDTFFFSQIRAHLTENNKVGPNIVRSEIHLPGHKFIPRLT